MPCVLNAANEIAVEFFLKGKIKFLEIQKTIRYMMGKHKSIPNPTINDIIEVDTTVKDETRKYLECSQ